MMKCALIGLSLYGHTILSHLGHIVNVNLTDDVDCHSNGVIVKWECLKMVQLIS